MWRGSGLCSAGFRSAVSTESGESRCSQAESLADRSKSGGLFVFSISSVRDASSAARDFWAVFGRRLARGFSLETPFYQLCSSRCS